ncbi:unnamed protein product [Macrosiphum euphorbiae]|uniref:Uncharacterized protein n=1 Tax=Macrosiphum euphorbiae TaxID=13131 RepID=A0AAV0Y1A8_9HEMI|nr:unnamed protein product [Macrosiphum euphorbiae]
MSNKNENNMDNTPKTYGPKATVAGTSWYHIMIYIFTTTAQNFLLIGLGMEIGMPTIVIQQLYRNSDSEFSLTLTEVSWYGSILFIFHPTGSFLSGFLQERYGRKRCMIFANVPSIFGWILLYYTHSTVSLYSFTVLMGLGIGFSEAPILSYVESPVWLVSKAKNEKAEKALCWLRGWVEPEIVKTEPLELIRCNEVSGTHRRTDRTIKNGCIYSTPWIPLTILCGINFFGASVNIFPWMLLSEVFPNK